MYEVKNHINLNLKNVDEFRKEIEAGLNEGYMILYVNKEREMSLCYNLGELSFFEWLGILEYGKNFLINSMEEEEDGAS